MLTNEQKTNLAARIYRVFEEYCSGAYANFGAVRHEDGQDYTDILEQIEEILGDITTSN